MAYAELSDFVDRYGADELTQLTGSATDSDRLAQALSDAGDEIDAYLSVRYRLPLDPVPRVLVRVACDITRYRLWDNAASEEVAARYAASVKFLQSVASGDVQLGVTPQPDGTPDALPLYSAVAPVFSRGTLVDFVEPGERSQ